MKTLYKNTKLFKFKASKSNEKLSTQMGCLVARYTGNSEIVSMTIGWNNDDFIKDLKTLILKWN
jgi:hypothetical protein